METTNTARGPIPRRLRRVAIWTNAAFPFLYDMRYLLTGRTFVGVARVLRDMVRYARAERAASSGFPLRLGEAYPALHDWFERAGSMPKHYFLQDLWGARKVFASGTPRHFDIGSRIDGFIAHCLCFTEVTLLDIRQLDIPVKGLSFRRANAMDMSGIDSDSIASLSTFHAIEHFGLGRYGDPIDPLGFRKALSEIQRVAAPLGNIYVGVPIGRQRLEFNGHRIFDPATIVGAFGRCELVEFSVIDDDDVLHEREDPARWAHLEFGAGLFHFRKRDTT